VCRQLHAIAQANGRRIPVWLITGAYSSDVAALGKEAGAVAVLRKPFDLSTLCQELEAQWQADSGTPPGSATLPQPAAGPNPSASSAAGAEGI
jgi:CheY-like chemotaxis protein